MMMVEEIGFGGQAVSLFEGADKVAGPEVVDINELLKALVIG